MQCADAINSFLVARIEEQECAEGMGLVCHGSGSFSFEKAGTSMVAILVEI